MQNGKKKTVVSNAVYQTVYQILIMITPLITAPFVSRQLGASNLGSFSYTYSIVSYFILIAMLGVTNYGTRAIAECQNDRKRKSDCFLQIYATQAMLSLLCIAIYLVFTALAVGPSLRSVGYVQAFWLVGCFFDINWFFYGEENFKTTVTRNIVIKILTVSAILIFVRKGNSPLLVYTLIMSLGTVISNLVLVPILLKQIDYSRPAWKDIKKHIKPNLVLFIPILASGVFHIMDKTMLGILSSKEQSGYYYNSDKIINIPVGILDGLGLVFLPRMTKIFAVKGDKKRKEQYLGASYSINVMISCLMAFGIAGVAKEFVPFFFGPGFEPCILLTVVFTPILIIKGISIFYRMQYLVPTKQDKIYAIATIAGALTNLVANYFLIIKYDALGAVIGTLIAEFAVALIQIVYVRKQIPVLMWALKNIPYLIFGGITVYIMRIVFCGTDSAILAVLLKALTGGAVYLILAVPYMLLTDRVVKNKFYDYIGKAYENDEKLMESSKTKIDETSKQFIGILASVLNKKSIDAVNVSDLTELRRFSDKHGMAALVGTALIENGIEIGEKWLAKINKAIFNYHNFLYETNKFTDWMNESGIWYVKLKGCAIEQYYSNPIFRQKSDVDVLVDPKRAKDIEKYMLLNGFKRDPGTDSHDIYIKSPGYSFEIHNQLVSRGIAGYRYYKDIGAKLISTDGSCEKKFTPEDFYIFTVVHAYKHWNNGGVGFRTLADLYLWIKANDMDFEYIESECKKIGVHEYEKLMRTLADKLFCNEDWESLLTEQEKKALAYIIDAGTFGNLQNRIKHIENKKEYFLTRMFPPVKYFRERFSVFIVPLYPIYWIYWITRNLIQNNSSAQELIKEIFKVNKNR